MRARPHSDGSAGDVNYAPLAGSYPSYRQPDPRLERVIATALGDARTVLNVGAGAGSYEPLDRTVTAVEPSQSMRDQRPAGRPAIDATAESLPFGDREFDAAMATFSVHQWSDVEAGLAEMRRVTMGPVVILTADPSRVEDFWLTDYAPEVMATEASRYPDLQRIARALGGTVEVVMVPIPFDCVDGFNEAYYGRPERLLEPGARAANSAWSFVGADVEERFARDLTMDLDSGSWDRKYGELRTQPFFDGSLRLVVGR